MTVGAARTPLAVASELLASYAGMALFVGIFGQDDGPAPSLALVAVIVLASFALARLLQWSPAGETPMRIAGVAASVAIFFVAARIEYAPGEFIWDPGWLVALISGDGNVVTPNGHVIAGCIALLPLWLRGVVRGQSELMFDDVLASVSLGMFAVILAALFSPDTREPAAWGALAFAYAMLALVTLALFSVPDASTALTTFARRWATGLAVLAAAAFGLAVLAAGIDPDAFGFLAPAGDAARYVGRLAGIYILNPILVALSWPFRGLASLIGGILPEQPPTDELQRRAPDVEEERDGSRPIWFTVLAWLIGGTVVAAIVTAGALLLWTAFRRYVRGRSTDERDRRDAVEPASSFGEDLSAMLGAITSRLRRPSRPRTAVEVRRLYLEMLDAAARRGLERPPSATPYEFAPPLDELFASDAPDALTAAFAASRYGEHSLEEDAVRELRERWRAVAG